MEAAGLCNNPQEPLGCLAIRVRSVIERALASYSSFAIYHPAKSIGIGIFLVLCSLPGVAFLETDLSNDMIYQQSSYSQRASEKMRDLFPHDPSLSSAMAYFSSKAGVNLFEEPSLVEAGRVVDQLLAVKTSSGEAFEDTCAKDFGGNCKVDSIFHFFRDVFATEEPVIPVQQVQGAGEVEEIAITIASTCATRPEWCREMSMQVDGLLVAQTPGSPSTGALHLSSLAVVFHLDPHRVGSDGADSNLAFQQAMMEAMHAPSYSGAANNFQTVYFDVIHWSRFAIRHEGARPGTAEGYLMGIAFSLVLVFVCIAIMGPAGAGQQSRVLVGLSSLVVVSLSLVCSLGVCAYVGVPFTPFSSLLVFTLLGVSVDDIIVMVHSYDNLPGLPTAATVKERIVESVHASGTTITLTSVTSFMAFLVASTVDFPAFRYVSVNGALGIFMIFVFQFTIFLPLFSIDEQRRVDGVRWRCCPWFGGGGEALASLRRVGVHCADKYRLSIGRPVVQGWVVIFFLLAASAGIWGAVEVSTDGNLIGYYMDDSFMINYFDLRSAYWEARAPLYLVTEHSADEGWFSEARRDEQRAVVNELLTFDWVFLPYTSWADDFEAYMYYVFGPDGVAVELERLRGDPVAFGAKVQEFVEAPAFLDQEGRIILPYAYSKDIVFEGGLVRASREILQYETDFSSQKRYISNFETTHSLMFPEGAGDGEQFTGSRLPETFEFADIMRAAERDERMKKIVYSNLGIACLAVCGVIALVLNPFVGIYMGFLVVCLDAMVVAMLIVYNATLDLVSYVCLALTIGLVVDYSTHTAHSYLHTAGTPQERLDYAVRTMGVSIISGGGSTLLGIMALAAASSEGFRMFFRILSTAIGLGTFFGVLISPVILCVLHMGLLKCSPASQLAARVSIQPAEAVVQASPAAEVHGVSVNAAPDQETR